MPEETATPEAPVTETAPLAQFDEPAVVTEAPPKNDFLAAFEADAPEPESPETPATAATEDGDEYPEVAPGKGSEHVQKGWKEIKSDLKATKAQLRETMESQTKAIQERDTELAELRKQVAEIPDLSEKAKYVTEAEKELAIARVEGTTEYKRAILAPLDAIGAAIETIAKANEIPVESLEDAILERDFTKRREMLNEILTGLTSVDAAEILGMAKDAQSILTKKDEMKLNAVEARKELEAITARTQTESQKKSREEFKGHAQHAVSELQKRIPFVELAAGETVEGVFASIAGKVESVDFDAAPTETKAYAQAAGLLLPRVTKQLLHVQAQLKKAEARIAEGNSSLATVAGEGGAAAAKDTGSFLGNVLGIQTTTGRTIRVGE